MDLIAYVFDTRITADDESFGEVRLYPFTFGVDAHEAEFLPAALHDVLDAEVELAGHYARVGLAGELVEEVEGYGVYFVIDVEAGLMSVDGD